VVDIEVEDRHSLNVGGRRIDLLSTPGGESVDAMCVWLPDEGIVFTGNLFGPIFNAMPNLTTIRGDKPRLSSQYLSSLARIRELNAAMLITGHGEPITGREHIRTSLQRMYDAVDWLRQTVIAGMNAGNSLYQLMHDIRRSVKGTARYPGRCARFGRSCQAGFTMKIQRRRCTAWRRRLLMLR
jgi:glyoxylase-like metal-dependent hydrolase (beta-lactamase superfamily II)